MEYKPNNNIEKNTETNSCTDHFYKANGSNSEIKPFENKVLQKEEIIKETLQILKLLVVVLVDMKLIMNLIKVIMNFKMTSQFLN